MSFVADPAHVLRLPLHARHVEQAAKWGRFGDWEVPLYYTSILDEHSQVRQKAGLFDVSHMGEFLVCGDYAQDWLGEMLPRNLATLDVNRALYCPLLNDRGGYIDDVIVYKCSPTRFWIVVNAGNIAKDFEWFRSHVPKGVELLDLSSRKGLLAIQGPRALSVLSAVYPKLDLARMPYYGFLETPEGWVARTGYTGEDGFEVMVDKAHLENLWDACFKHPDLRPVGFGARDTLRLEAAMPLYGHDMDDSRTPFEASAAWAVDLQKEKFIGSDALRAQKKTGPKQILVGFEMLDRGIPRQGYKIQHLGKIVGEVTSGSFSPTLQKNIGLGYVETACLSAGMELEVHIRNQALKAKLIKLPFYRRKKDA